MANERIVYIADLKETYPSYNDDAILEEAILLAQALGATAKIVWDGEDIYFDGISTHELKGFGGIDFNGSTIYMPNYDLGTILSIVPDTTSDLTVDASVFFETYTSDNNLKGKVFQVNDNEDGNATMCLGDRASSSFTSTIYCSPTIKTTPTGLYETGKLFLVPSSGDVECYNIHDYPEITFDISNATVISYNSANMSIFVSCERSNTHIHNIKLEGRSNITSFHHGVFRFRKCCGIEIDNIFGVNPVQSALTSGYAIGLYSVSCAHVHDVYIGDDLSWGVVGCNHLVNTVFEHCYLNRWDCHYAQYGYNVIRDCVLNGIEYGIGCGILEISNCTFILAKTSNSIIAVITLRSDMPGVFDGDIIVRGCSFITKSQPVAKIIIWDDSCYWSVPENTSIPVMYLNKNRIIENCNLINGCYAIFKAGFRLETDQALSKNVRYVIRDTTINCSESVMDVYNDTQELGSIEIEKCVFTAQSYITKLAKKVNINISGSNFGDYLIKVIQNLKSVTVSESKINKIVSDSASNVLIMIGNAISGTQEFSGFNNYSAYGNVNIVDSSINNVLNAKTSEKKVYTYSGEYIS